MKKSNIYVFSRPIRTGKTTELMRWLEGKTNIAGILSPDVDGVRSLLDLHSRELRPLETAPGADAVQVGRFCFSLKAFEWAQDILLHPKNETANWLVIDEVGKLELDEHGGLEPAIGVLLEKYRKGLGGNLLLVIRDTLLQKAIHHYNLPDAVIVHELKELK